MKQITIRVYGPLNDFLPRAERQSCRSYAFEGRASVKDLIERLGVPHPEIDLILVNGNSVPFGYPVQDADRVSVFPRFHALDIDGLTQVRPPPHALGSSTGATARFVLDGHLGKLARHLRLLGLDTAYAADARDEELADVAAREGRILLTRDLELLKRRVVTEGYFVRETAPRRQLSEVLRRFWPLPVAPFSRCLRCNAELRAVPKSVVEARLPLRTRRYYDEFRACPGCDRVYWKGSHWSRLMHVADAVLHEVGDWD
jgi:uncharacterized protein with PIN domain